MTGSQNITPVIIISCLVIFLSCLFLVCTTPAMYHVHSVLNPPDPNVICLYPPAEENTMRVIWETIEERSGIDRSSAAFSDMQVGLTPNETIEDLTLSFYATKNGQGRMFRAYLRYTPEHCGTLDIRSTPTDIPEFSARNPVSPREFLMELPQVRLSQFGIANQAASISTGIGREQNLRYNSLPCIDLFLLENRTLTTLNTVIITDTQQAVSHWTIHSMHCFTSPDGGKGCSSDRNIHVFPETRMTGAYYSWKTTGNDRSIILNECPHSPVERQSCRTTIFGTSCTNGTEY